MRAWRLEPRPAISTLAALAIFLAGWLNACTSSAQVVPGDSIPSRVYFNTFPSYYDGELRSALASYLAQSRGGIHSVSGRWIDSICYFTMAGECYYQLGQLPAALDSYTAALKLYIAYSNWMMRVQFPPTVLPAVGAPRAAPWGQSKRGAAIGQFPETFLIAQGQVDQTAVVRQGGVVQNPLMVAIHVAEIVRATSLAIRRRRELLGPLSKSDPLSSTLVDALSRRAGPPNHWSEAWIQVQLGCAYAAAGNAPQAKTALERAILVGGQFDHPLTSTALLELGHLAFEAGDFPAAGRYFEEATYASWVFPNATNLEEAFRLGALAHLLSGPKTPFPLLAPAIAWAKSQGNRQLQTSLLSLAAENMATLGDHGQAAGFVTAARAVVGRSDLAASQQGARLNYVASLTAYQAGNVAAGDQALAAAFNFQRSGALWLFHIAQTDARYLSGDLTDRTGLTVYETVLRDPTPADWASSPLECLSMLSTPHEAALEHWFEAALKNSREHELALEIADRARRHRFFSTLPMGGRLLSLRWILEGPVELLGERGLLQRQELLARYPKYAELARQALAVRAKLAEQPVVRDSVEERHQQAEQLRALAEISENQELILREIAVRREPAEMVFPPLRKTRDIQQALGDGQVLLAFFATSRNLYAFLYAREKYAAWHIASPVQLQKQISNLLREMGNFEVNHELSHQELTKGAWNATADKVLHLLLERSNVDLAGNFDEIAIVPDGILWYLPFDALPVGKGEDKQPLISRARVRYAPTAGLAVPYTAARKPHPNIGVVLGKLHPQDDESVASAAFDELAPAVTGAVALPHSLGVASSVYRTLLDGLIVLDDIEPAGDVYAWSPVQLDRGKQGAALANWFSLPWGGPEQVILPGFHTAAENGLRRGHADGDDLFLSVCGLMSAGARTVLISRWRAGGQTGIDLVREFAQELPQTSPAQAWQRSVQIAADTPIEIDREPRVKKASSTGEPTKAGHPFFWAGYMLVDSGLASAEPDGVAAPPGPAVPKLPPQAKAANPPPATDPAQPAEINAPAAQDAPAKGNKKSKPPRAASKKAPQRKKPGPRDPQD